MKRSISNIAWALEDSERVAELMREFGVGGVEIAPTVCWPNPTEVGDAELREVRAFWEDHGIPIVALQSLVYGRPDLTLFESASVRTQLLEHLKRLMHVAHVLGAGPMVFGSPKNRKKGELPSERAMELAVDFFRKAGKAADEHGVVLCIEPNPSVYDCDFVTQADQAIELVRDVGEPGFGLHLDAAGMLLAGDEGPQSIREAVRRTDLCHFHVSEPFLAPIGSTLDDAKGVDHRALAEALRAEDYTGWCSVEMRAVEPDRVLPELRRVLAFHADVYSDERADARGEG